MVKGLIIQTNEKALEKSRFLVVTACI